MYADFESIQAKLHTRTNLKHGKFFFTYVAPTQLPQLSALSHTEPANLIVARSGQGWRSSRHIPSVNLTQPPSRLMDHRSTSQPVTGMLGKALVPLLYGQTRCLNRTLRSSSHM